MYNRPIIKRQGRGFVSHDGNHMVGGAYAYSVRLFYAEVDFDDALEITSERDDSDEIWLWFMNYLNGDTVTVEAYFSVGYDHSVGISYHCDLEEQFYSSAFDEAADRCPLLSDDEKAAVKAKMVEIIDNLDGEKYTAYE